MEETTDAEIVGSCHSTTFDLDVPHSTLFVLSSDDAGTLTPFDGITVCPF
jgi:hypothetical protein